MVHFLCYVSLQSDQAQQLWLTVFKQMRNPKNNDENSNHYAWPVRLILAKMEKMRLRERRN